MPGFLETTDLLGQRFFCLLGFSPEKEPKERLGT